MEIGSTLYHRSMRVSPYHPDSDTSPVATFSYSAGKKAAYCTLLLGVVPKDKVKEWNANAALEDLGWVFLSDSARLKLRNVLERSLEEFGPDETISALLEKLT